jgi:hypothetical protein
LNTGDGRARGASAAAAAASAFAEGASLAAAAAEAVGELARDAVDGLGNGPVSREQPAEAQPVAAGPVKVGAPDPRLDDVTVWVALAAGAADAPPENATNAIGSDNSDSRVMVLRTRLFLIGCI